MRPLRGLKVVDVSRLLPGGFCTMILADLGATVIKVEQPYVGDYMRLAPPLVGGVSPFHSTVNKNKQSISIDLKKADGRNILRKIVAKSDVFVEAFRPGVMQRLGLDFRSLKKVNKGIVYCSISGFGQNEELSNLPGHDLNFQAMSGIFTNSKRPSFPTVQLADMISGLYAANAILAALFSKRRPIYIDIPITQSLTSLLILHLGSYLKDTASDFEGLLYGEDPYYSIYKTKDRKFIALAAIEEKFRKNLLDILQASNVKQSNLRHREIDRDYLQSIFKQRDRDEWFRLLSKKDTCVTPVLDIAEVIEQSWCRVCYDAKRKVLKAPIVIDGQESFVRRNAPSIGQDTKHILKQLGYTPEQIKRLKEKGVVQY